MKGLYGAKSWYTVRLQSLLNFAIKKNLSPDFFTYFGMVAAGFGGIAIAKSYWVLAGIFIALRLAGANLDGALARAQGSGKPFGFVMNEIGDRVGDIFLLTGFVFIGKENGVVEITLLAMFAASIPTFISLAGAGAGVSRINGGPFGKTERCLTLFIFTLLNSYISQKAILVEITATIIIIGSLLTSILRAAEIKKNLRRVNKE